MTKLEISEEQRTTLHGLAEALYSNGDLYLPEHIRPVARNCKLYATHLAQTDESIDPIVCEIGGLFHDVGYSRVYESAESDHIAKGVEMAPGILAYVGITGDYAEQIVDTIWTHDGNLNRSRYGEAPLNNQIVNDVDAMQLFDWNLASLMEFSLRLQPDRPTNEVAQGLLEHVHQTIPYITMPFFKELAQPKYDARVRELEAFL